MGRKLGQHFLKNDSALSESARITASYGAPVIIEIGPGHGELTTHLKNQISNLKNNTRIVAIERDTKLAEKLKERLKNTKDIEIIDGDVLKILPEIVGSLKKPYAIAGNIPYYITGHLLRVIGEMKNKPEAVILVIQKEVAERIAAKSPKMNLLAACTQVWAEPKIIRKIPKKDFSPPPEVDSALIVLETKKGRVADRFYAAAKILFSHPRKTVLNNMSGALPKKNAESILGSAGIESNARPQNLSIENITSIAEMMYNDGNL